MSLPSTTLNDMPRLKMFLSLDSHGLTLSGDAEQLPKTNEKSPPLLSNAKKWLHSCAVAQRLMETNGSSELFNEQPLHIRIQSPDSTGFEILKKAPPAIQEWGSLAMTKTMFHASEWISKILGPRTGPPHGLIESFEQYSTNPYLDLKNQETQTQSPQGELVVAQRIQATVILPERTMTFDRHSGMAAHFPSWSDAEIAQFITLHEAGHAAHLGTALGQADLYGYQGAAKPVATAMGLLGISEAKKSPFPDLCEIIFREIYADAFAALAMGAMDKNKTLHALDEIMSFRRASQPVKLSEYGNGDATHDTREGLMSLRERIDSITQLPQGPASIHRTCIEAAQTGIIRWAISVASQPSGSTGASFWKHAKAFIDKPENQEAKRSYEHQYDQIVISGQQDPQLGELCMNMADTPAGSKAFMAFGLSLLMSMRDDCGAPRVDLRGNLRERSAWPALLDKIANRRESQSAPRHKPQPPHA